MKLSAILCTHNPRKDYLERTLSSLRSQSLPADQWELVVIDNASGQHLAGQIDLAWHQASRVVREESLGLTQARLRGIKEARGEILVFVDDDNVLDADYFEQALRIAAEWPVLGAWSGSIVPSFEVSPPPWSKPYLCYLALREVTEDKWSNSTDNPGLMPWGAGLCVRISVASEYTRRLSTDPVRQSLDRRGRSLASCGDSDLAMTACDIGLGTGLFRSLKLTHIIPAGRLQEDYFARLLEGMGYSLTILAALRRQTPIATSLPRLLWGYFAAARRGRREFRFYRASVRGQRAAWREMALWDKSAA